MKYLFFDTETTGLPHDFDAPAEDLGNWPRVVQLGWRVAGENGQSFTDLNFIIKPDGFIIPSGMIHGISHEKAMKEGHSLTGVLKLFEHDLKRSNILVAHNYDFDAPILGVEFLRVIKKNPLETYPSYCTMKQTTGILKLPGPYGYKWPSLQELHHFCFQKGFEGAHDALADVEATFNCFFHLKEKGAFNKIYA